jgi:hypothetical protein
MRVRHHFLFGAAAGGDADHGVGSRRAAVGVRRDRRSSHGSTSEQCVACGQSQVSPAASPSSGLRASHTRSRLARATRSYRRISLPRGRRWWLRPPSGCSRWPSARSAPALPRPARTLPIPTWHTSDMLSCEAEFVPAVVGDPSTSDVRRQSNRAAARRLQRRVFVLLRLHQ